MSHKNQKNQRWKEEKIEEAKVLWAANEGKPPKEQLSMRAIAKQLGLPKTTVIEQLSGRRVGEGHIAGGKRKARVLMDGKQMGQFNCNHNCNRTSTGSPSRSPLRYFVLVTRLALMPMQSFYFIHF